MAASVEQGARAWHAARSFAELCELGARFIEGEVEFFPGWGAPDIDEETDALVPLLADLNRAGFLTCASQPGHAAAPGHDGKPWRRRAFVSGFVAAPLAPDLARATHAAGLEWCADPASPPLAAGVRDGEPFLFAGAGAGPDELEIFAEAIGPAALAKLRAALYVSVVDPGWDDRTLLWDTLAAALRERGTGRSE